MVVTLHFHGRCLGAVGTRRFRRFADGNNAYLNREHISGYGAWSPPSLLFTLRNPTHILRATDSRSPAIVLEGTKHTTYGGTAHHDYE
jgi:hypothetical protein